MSYENLIVIADDSNHEKYNFTSKLYIFFFIIILYEQRFHCLVKKLILVSGFSFGNL